VHIISTAIVRKKTRDLKEVANGWHTGAVTRYDFPSDISLRYAFGKNLMMLTQKSNKKIISKSVGVLFSSTV
jgi:hypothetical protein